MVQIMKFGDGRITGFEHLHKSQSRDRLDVLRRQTFEKRIQARSPGPEAVGRVRPPGLAPTRQGALERVAVQVARGRKHEAPAQVQIAGRGGRAGRHGGDEAIAINGDTHILGPAARQQSGSSQQVLRLGHESLAVLTILAYT